MKRDNIIFKKILGIMIAVLILNFNYCTEKKEDKTPLLVGIALASQSSRPVANTSNPYDTEAASAGYTLPNAPVKGVSSLVLADSGTSLDIREDATIAQKIDLVNKTDARYTPTSTSSTTRGTCIWTSSSSNSCIYNYTEGACTVLGQTTGTTSIDFTTDTTSSTCTSRGYTSNCTATTVGENTYTQCVNTGTSSSTTQTNYYYNTTTGVISYGFSISSFELGTSVYTVQIWVNGQSSAINFSSTGSRVTNRLVLNNGVNYVLITVSSGGAVIARSYCYRVDSTVQSSILRAELSWNGTGDLDLHMDDGSGGKHVYYASKTYSDSSTNIALDVDNVTGYGPENIRIYQSPVSTSYRFYVNYYSGSNNLTGTVKVYNGTRLLETKTLAFTSADVNTNTSFHATSKLVGRYMVTGNTTATIGSLQNQ